MAEVERQDQEVQIPGRFEAFYREEYPAVVALVYGLTDTAWSAEDLAQGRSSALTTIGPGWAGWLLPRLG